MVMGSYVLLQQRKAEKEKKNWQKKVDLELPGITQALTLMISAGISPVRAMQLVSGRSESLVAQELRSIVNEVMEGESAVRAIDNFARRVGSPGSRRFSNSISIAIERGTPLVPVLTALLKDAQVDSKNEMLRRAGKAEIALLLPVVFLLLPISVLFALFPSITQLQAF
jgi:tight adherence protein C